MVKLKKIPTIYHTMEARNIKKNTHLAPNNNATPPIIDI
jgi:hypothetical protein